MSKKSLDPRYLELRYNTYFAVLYIPKDIRFKFLGKTKFIKTTNTGDLKRAKMEASRLVMGWKSQIERARSESDDPIVTEANDLEWQRRRTDLIGNPVEEVIEQRYLEIVSENNVTVADDFKAIATGKQVELSSLISAWKEHETKRGLKTKTVDQMVRDVTLLTNLFRTAQRLEHEYVTAWIKKIAKENNLSASSVTRIIGFWRNFFKYLKLIKQVPQETPDPFIIPDEYKKSKKRNAPDTNRTESWIPFEEDDVVLLYKEAINKKDQPLADLIIIAAYTGARIEEICSLKCKDVYLDRKYLNIIDAKTTAGIRTVPIHSKLNANLNNLINSSNDGYIISGLTFNKYNNRSNAIGKRFGRLKKKLGYSDPQVFHSIRKTLTTKLENAGVAENVAADIVGHDKPTMTYGLYSGGTILEVKRTAIEKISYKF